MLSSNSSFDDQNLYEDDVFKQYYGYPEGFAEAFETAARLLKHRGPVLLLIRDYWSILKTLNTKYGRSWKAHVMSGLLYERIGWRSRMFAHFAVAISLSPRRLSAEIEVFRRTLHRIGPDAAKGILFAVHDKVDGVALSEDELDARLAAHGLE